MFRFSVFGDVHGRVPLMLLLSRAWQTHTGQTLDGILQVGDMGAFPDHRRLDKATARHARHDPDELDFVHFLSDTPLARSLLADPDTPPVAFCRGNHEDFDFLGRYRVVTALDPYHKLWYVPDGEVMHWRGDDGALTVAAFGGASPLREPEDGRGRRARDERRRRARRQATSRFELGPRFTEEAATQAFPGGGPVDVLLTHAGPEHEAFPHGCGHLAALVERVSPRVHLFGHHHQVVGPVEHAHGGHLVGLEHLEFLRDTSLRDGAWGILELAHEVRFTWMNQAEQPWMQPFRRGRWRDMVPSGG